MTTISIDRCEYARRRIARLQAELDELDAQSVHSVHALEAERLMGVRRSKIALIERLQKEIAALEQGQS